MCLSFQWFLGSLDCAIVPLLSQNSIMGCTTKGMTLSPMRNFISQMTCFAASEIATYSASVMESSIQDYFTLLQLTIILPKVKTKLKVDQ